MNKYIESIDLAVHQSQMCVDDAYANLYCKNAMMCENSSNEVFQESMLTPVTSKELDCFKFENKHILKAIQYFNKSISTLPFDDINKFFDKKTARENGKLSVKNPNPLSKQDKLSIINKLETYFRDTGGYFIKAFDELAKQFKCFITVYISNKYGTGTIMRYTEITNEKLTISKSKGFQLENIKIEICVNVWQLLHLVPADPSLFGQAIVGIMLHEIYHNIARFIDQRNMQVQSIMKNVINQSANVYNNAKSSIETFLSKFVSMFGISNSDFKNIDRVKRRLYVLSQIKSSSGGLRKFEEDLKTGDDKTNSDEELEDYIKQLKTERNVIVIMKVGKALGIICMIILGAVGFVQGSAIAAASGAVCMVILSLKLLFKQLRTLLGLNVGLREEYYCDLFAAMYKLPIHLHSYNREINLNKKNSEKVTEIRRIEQQISSLYGDVHPLTFDREVTSYKMAKQLLASGEKLDPEIKKYLQYIVKMHEGIENIKSPENEKQTQKLDPAKADDLRKSVKELAEKKGIAITESFIEYFVNGGESYA